MSTIRTASMGFTNVTGGPCPQCGATTLTGQTIVYTDPTQVGTRTLFHTPTAYTGCAMPLDNGQALYIDDHGTWSIIPTPGDPT